MNPDQDPTTPEWAERVQRRLIEATNTDRRARITYLMGALGGEHLRLLLSDAERRYAAAKATGEALS